MTEASPQKKMKLGSHKNPDYDMQQFSVLHMCVSKESPIQGQQICEFANTYFLILSLTQWSQSGSSLQGFF